MQNADIMTRNMDPIIKRFEGPVEFGKNSQHNITHPSYDRVYTSFLTLFVPNFQ